MSDTDWSKVLGWPGYRVYQHEIDEVGKRPKLWVRRKSGNGKLVCSGCGRKLAEAYDTYEREVRDLPCFEFRTTVVVVLYRVRCPDCGVKTEKVPQLPSKAPFSKRFEEAVGLMARCRRISTVGNREKLLSDRCPKAVTKPHLSYLVDSSAGRNFLAGACFAPLEVPA
jgi:transposase